MPLAINELRQRVNLISAIFQSILNDQTAWNSLGPDKQQQLTTGINKAYGQAMAFQHEYLTTMRAQQKGRATITQVHADVTVGAANELFAKSIECKSITQPDKGSVNAAIIRAISQLAGQTNHFPRPSDVRVVDVNIDGCYNPWPMPGGAYGIPRQPVSLDNILQEAMREIYDIVRSADIGITSIRQWLEGEMLSNAQQIGRAKDLESRSTSTFPPITSKPFPNSSRPVFSDTNNQVNPIRCLSIKIRYMYPYFLINQNSATTLTSLSELIVQIYKKPTGLVVETAKIKKVSFDLTTNTVTQDRIWS